MARSTVKDLTHGSPLKLILGFSVPLLFGLFFQQLYNFVDTAIVGRTLGAEALAAVGSTGCINFMILGFCMGMCSGFSIPIAQAFGAQDETELRRFVGNAIYVSGALSIVLAVVTSLLCPWMLRMLNTPEDIIGDALAYIQPIFMAIPVTVLYNMSSGILRSLGDSKTPVYFVAMAALINIALDIVFIIHFDMGVRGAAIATIISQLFSGVGCLIVMKMRFPILQLSRDDRKFRPQMASQLVGMGIPMGLQFSITAIGSVVIQTAINGLGTVYVAAVAAASKLCNLFYCVIDALATTMATFSGQNVGARKVYRIHKGLKTAVIIGAVYSVAVFLVAWLLGRPLLTLFVSGDETVADVIAYGHHYLLYNTIPYFLLLLVNLLRFSVQGMGFTRAAMFAGVAEMIARTAVALLLVPVWQFNGACLANPLAWLAADLFLFPCYLHVSKRLAQRLGCPDRKDELHAA
ncbi:MAG: MATE family efflux transporter [Clostridiales bacterium]|nr:MATE family efflux transporter [Clostridiales bacterium]